VNRHGGAALVVIVNKASGKRKDDDIINALRKAFADSGLTPDIRLPPEPSALSGLAEAAVRERPPAIVAAGGDGTIRTVAAAVAGSGIPFGVVPLGTFNWFARDLGLPDDMAACAGIIRSGSLRDIGVGEINGRVFLVNCSLGLYRRLIEERERHKSRFGRNRLVAYLSGLYTALRPHPFYAMDVAIDREHRQVRTPLIFVAHNKLQLESYGFDVARVRDFGRLVAIVPKAVGRGGLLKLALRGLLGRLAGAPELDVFEAREIRIGSRRGRVKVAIDGEVVRCTMPLTIAIADRALRVLVPDAKNAAEESRS
jgi:diacylglycerol kinase family enzyme